MTSPAPKRPTEHYELTWRDLRVRISYDPDAYGAPGQPHHTAHLQVENAVPDQALPISETGYRSHFLPFGEVEAGGGVIAYVRRWLDASALKPAWKAIERDQRQGCLF